MKKPLNSDALSPMRSAIENAPANDGLLTDTVTQDACILL